MLLIDIFCHYPYLKLKLLSIILKQDFFAKHYTGNEKYEILALCYAVLINIYFQKPIFFKPNFIFFFQPFHDFKSCNIGFIYATLLILLVRFFRASS